jgi:hypothetical protein
MKSFAPKFRTFLLPFSLAVLANGALATAGEPTPKELFESGVMPTSELVLGPEYDPSIPASVQQGVAYSGRCRWESTGNVRAWLLTSVQARYLDGGPLVGTISLYTDDPEEPMSYYDKWSKQEAMDYATGFGWEWLTEGEFNKASRAYEWREENFGFLYRVRRVSGRNDVLVAEAKRDDGEIAYCHTVRRLD